MVEFRSMCRADKKIVGRSLTVGRRGAFCPNVADRHGASQNQQPSAHSPASVCVVTTTTKNVRASFMNVTTGNDAEAK